MEEILYVALAPFYAAAVYSTWWGITYGIHIMRRVDQSATETQQTETIPAK